MLLRYVIKELFLYFLICFGFFFVAFFVNEILVLAKEILARRVPLVSVMKLIAYRLPNIVAQSTPFATLVGFLMCIGKMVTDNEILVFRASGQRYSLLAVPVVILGLFISLFSFVMNDYFLPLGAIRFNRLRKQIIQRDPAVEVEPHSIKHMNDTTLVIGDVDDANGINDMVIFNKDASGKERIIVTHQSEVKKSDRDGILMQFTMDNATVFLLDKMNRTNFDVMESQSLLLNVFDTALDANTHMTTPGEMTSFDLWKQIKTMEKDENVTYKRLNRYRLEFHRKYSIPFGSFFFALLAFPLALVFGKRDGQTLGFVFGIIISVLYWAATILGQIFGSKGGLNGFWMMWTPNLCIGLIGILLYLRLRRK